MATQLQVWAGAFQVDRVAKKDNTQLAEPEHVEVFSVLCRVLNVSLAR